MMERKTSGFELKRLDEKGQFVARIARLNQIDLDNDVTLPGAFGNDQVAPILVGHNWQQIPLGKAAIREEGDEVLAYGTLNLALDAGRSFYEALKFDVAHPPTESEFSYGFVVKASEPGLFTGQRVRFLKSLHVLEVSGVIAGAGDTALVAVKNASERWDREEVLSYFRTLPIVEQQARIEQVRGLCAEINFLITAAEFEALTAEKALTGKAFKYKFVYPPPEDPRRQAATAGLIAAAAELRSTEPSLRFFTEALPGDDEVDFISAHPLVGASGIPAHPNVVAVHEKLSPAEVLETVGHEVAHFARPGLPEPKVEEFGRELARKHNLRPALVPVPVFLTPEEARELRKHQTVHYSPGLNAEFVLALRAVPAQRPQPTVPADRLTVPADRLTPSPLSGRPVPQPSHV